MEKSFEDRVFDAIVAQFFAGDSNGYSPVRNIAYQMFQQRQEEIVNAVVANLDTEKLAEEMAKHVVKELNSPAYGYGASNVDRAELKKRVREKVANALAERELARMDAESGAEPAK